MADAGHRDAPPTRGPIHDALEAFVGRWRASGESYGDASPDEPGSEPWTSTHVARWHGGRFFLVQDETAVVGGAPFETLSVIGVDDDGSCFAHTFENHGFHRRYEVSVDGRVWTFAGASERARLEFSADGTTQAITWEWLRDGRWLPLCDRVAVRDG